MKKYNLIALCMVIVLGLFSACVTIGDEGDGPENAIYMANASSNGVISMTVSGDKGGSTFVTPRLANISQETVIVTVEIDYETLDRYNKENNLELFPIASEDFVFITKDGTETSGQAHVAIEKGDFQGSVEVRMKQVDDEKYPYSKGFAIPVAITGASKYNVLKSPISTIIRLDRQLKTSIGKMSNGNIQLRPKTPYVTPMTEWTFQMSMIYSTLTRSNLTTAYIADHGGGEFYTRINATTGIQIKNGRDGDDTWTQKPLSAGVWLHISYVYKDQSISVYVNGELQKTFKTTPIYLKNTAESGWMIGNDGYRDDYIREVRFWDKALTEAEIIDKLYLPQDPETPGLLLYMPVTKETELNDLTGDWNVAKGNSTRIEYIENVIFPADKLIIEEDEE